MQFFLQLPQAIVCSLAQGENNPLKGYVFSCPRRILRLCVYYLANENKLFFAFLCPRRIPFLNLLKGFETNTDIADISRTVRIRNQFSLAQGEHINGLSKTVTDSSNTLQESVLFCVQRFL